MLQIPLAPTIKRFAISVAILALFHPILTAHAKSDFKIGIVSMERIEKEGRAILHLKKELEKEEKKINKMLEAEKKEAKKKVEEIGKIADSLSKSALEKKQKNLQEELVSTEKKLQKMAIELKEKESIALTEVNNTIKSIARRVCKKKGLFMAQSDVLQLYYDEEIDITDDVIKILNKELKKVEL